MISIRCAELEIIRKNPTAYGQQMAVSAQPSKGGSHGMLACVKEVAKTFHDGERTLNQAISDLHKKFLRYADTHENGKRQEDYISKLVSYNAQFMDKGFNIVHGHKKMKWAITPGSQVIRPGLQSLTATCILIL